MSHRTRTADALGVPVDEVARAWVMLGLTITDREALALSQADVDALATWVEMRAFIGEPRAFTPRLFTVIPVVAVAAMLMSPLLVPIGRWCMRVKSPDLRASLDHVDVAE